MKYEESMRIVVENSKGEQSFFEVRDKESINEIKRIIGKVNYSFNLHLFKKTIKY